MLLRARRAVLLDCSRGSSADCSLKGAPGACLLADKAGQAQSPADAAEVAGRACWRNHQHGDGTHVGGAACWRRRSQGRGEGAGTFIRSDRPGQQPHPTSPREPAGACKSRPVCREPAGPPRPSRLHCTRALHPNGCAISTPSYRCPRQSPPQAASTPLPHRLVRSSSRAVDRTNLHAHTTPLSASAHTTPLSQQDRGVPGSNPTNAPAVTNLCSPWR